MEFGRVEVGECGDAAGPAGLHVEDAVRAGAVEKVAQVRSEIAGCLVKVHA
ncbi:hypothetical protein GCM10008956_23240 [Deinococcus arenae]|uniref:Uncharacterized protein n=1 Tax=Deinococcus arenae TaxID=1452751 RepID=A0A8H9GVW3_9DEIO|nr:hypothetical protein GCM10008956_23240 [Deinococcus arenae]